MAPLDRKLLAAALSEERVAASTKAERKAMHNVFGRSFAGSKTTPPEATMHWVLGPHLANIEDPERVRMTTFFMSFSTALSSPKSTTLCTHGTSGEVSAILLVQKCKRAPGPSPIADMFRWIGNIVTAMKRNEVRQPFSIPRLLGYVRLALLPSLC